MFSKKSIQSQLLHRCWAHDHPTKTLREHRIQPLPDSGLQVPERCPKDTERQVLGHWLLANISWVTEGPQLGPKGFWGGPSSPAVKSVLGDVVSAVQGVGTWDVTMAVYSTRPVWFQTSPFVGWLNIGKMALSCRPHVSGPMQGHLWLLSPQLSPESHTTQYFPTHPWASQAAALPPETR